MTNHFYIISVSWEYLWSKLRESSLFFTFFQYQVSSTVLIASRGCFRFFQKHFTTLPLGKPNENIPGWQETWWNTIILSTHTSWEGGNTLASWIFSRSKNYRLTHRFRNWVDFGFWYKCLLPLPPPNGINSSLALRPQVTLVPWMSGCNLTICH